MMDFFWRLFDTSGFPPRWYCGDWTEGHGWLHIASDIGICAAYLAIPLVLVYFILRRADTPFPRIFWLFAAFILFCGVGHGIEASLFWNPWYRLSGLFKLLTAVASWVTVIALIPLIPKAMALPGLEAVNRQLKQEIADRKRAEEERRKLESQIQQTQKLESLGVLAGGIAHDFNNLLTSILGYADLAINELPPQSPARSLIQESMNGARRAAELTNQMLAYSGKGRFVIQPLNLAEIVEGIRRLLQVSISKSTALRFDFAPNLPAIEGDAAQLRQVVMNLIINASEAIGEKGGVISVGIGVTRCDRRYLSEVYLDENLPEGDYVHIEVADTGSGMTEETRNRIFDPFFTTKFTGRGLGLAAVLGIVRGHRGAIKVYSELDKGTTIKVLFPATTRLAVSEEPTPTVTTEWRAQGTALVVDDEASVRQLAEAMLRRMGFSVVTANDGMEALTYFRRSPNDFAIVLLDMTMPNMDGENTFRELRQIRENVRVVLTSGYNEQVATNRFVGKGLAQGQRALWVISVA